jgi:hypothetical protein
LLGNFFFPGFAAVALLAVVAFGHPDRLYALAVGKAHQVADGSIRGNESLLDRGESDQVIFRELGAEQLWQSCDAIQRVDALPVEGIEELPAAVGGLSGFQRDGRKLLSIKTQKFFLRWFSHASYRMPRHWAALQLYPLPEGGACSQGALSKLP